MVAFKEENTVAFKYLFLKGYSGIDEDNYSCSVYTQEDAYESIFYAINQASFCVNDLYFKNILVIVLAKKNYMFIKIF